MRSFEWEKKEEQVAPPNRDSRMLNYLYVYNLGTNREDTTSSFHVRFVNLLFKLFPWE